MRGRGSARTTPLENLACTVRLALATAEAARLAELAHLLGALALLLAFLRGLRRGRAANPAAET